MVDYGSGVCEPVERGSEVEKSDTTTRTTGAKLWEIYGSDGVDSQGNIFFMTNNITTNDYLMHCKVI